MTHRVLVRIFLVVSCALLLIPPVTSNASPEAEADQTLSPFFHIQSGDTTTDSFPLKLTHVDVTISGVIADIVVTQRYRNEGLNPINARYIFPASTRVAVHGMKMIIGDQIIIAKIEERKQAQKKFDEAKKAGKNASLLKQQRPNVFSMNVANIMPGDTIDLELHYTELLVPTDGTYEFVYPTVVGPRYANQLESEAPETDQWVKTPYLPEGTIGPDKDTVPARFDIQVEISTGIPLEELTCTSYETDVLWKDASTAAVTLGASDDHLGDRDYILKYRLAGRQIQSGLMLYEGDEENFFLLMMEPPERVLVSDIPTREYVFVLDVSGSMRGFPLDTAKDLMRELLGGLRPTDRFNVILFEAGAQQLAPDWMQADPASINEAIRLIDQRRGGGGTELRNAMEKALSLPSEESYSRSTIVVTDGYITAEADVFRLIAENLHVSNVFAFGIGSGVNRYLIEGVAHAGMGEPFVVTHPDEAPAAAVRFRNYVASPTLTNVDINFEGFETYDVEPTTIPDLFAQRPIVVFGKWRGLPAGTIELRGISGSSDYQEIFRVQDIQDLERNKALRHLWARKKIERLSYTHANKGGDEYRAEITNLGLTYELLTQFTSFVAVHDVVRTAEEAKNVDQPLPLPKNVSNLAVGVTMAKVPEPELWLLVVLVGVAGMIWTWIRLRTRCPVQVGHQD